MVSKRTRVFAGIAGVAVLGTIVAVSVARENRRRVKVQTEEVSRRDLTSKVSASGEVKPKRFVNVSANISGRITHLLVDEGQSVARGQVLARIDSTRLEAGTRQSEAAVEAARADLERTLADLELSRLAFERQKRVHEQQLVSDEVFDRAQAELKMKAAVVESQRRRIAQAQAALATIRDDLEKTTIVSPMDGVVIDLRKEQGEVAIGAQSFQPTVIMTVADLSVMEAEILIDETDISDVDLGQEAEVEVDALRDLKIAGRVTEIGSSAIPRGGAGATASSTSNQAKDFKVVVTLEDPPASLRPGLNATAEITTARKSQVLAVPIQAVVVREVDDEGKVIEPRGSEDEDSGNPAPRSKGEEKEGVFVVSDGKAVFRPVETGILGETQLEILEGLDEGEKIVSGSYRTLRTLKNEALVKVEKKKKDEE
jgi:HlyD family secretion protein